MTTKQERAEARRLKRIEAIKAAMAQPQPEPEAIAPVAAEPEAQSEPVEIPQRRSVVPLRWQRVYAHNALKGTCDDGIAKRLADATKGADGKCSIALLEAIGERNGIDVRARWGTRNVGMQRMNLSNVLRGMVKRGEDIAI